MLALSSSNIIPCQFHEKNYIRSNDEATSSSVETKSKIHDHKSALYNWGKQKPPELNVEEASPGITASV